MAMMQFTFDPNAKPNDGPRGDYTPTPEGTHHIKVLGMEQLAPKPGKEHGSVAIKYEVVQSEDATAIGRSRTFWLQLSPSSTPYFLVPFVQACGVQVQQGQQMTPQGPQPSIAFDPDHCVGAIVMAKCKHQKGDKKVFEDWTDFAVSSLNPLLAGQPNAPAMQPAPAPQNIPQAVQGYAGQPQVFGQQQAAQPQPSGFGYPQQPGFQQQQQAPQGMPAPQGAMPPRRFG